MVFFMGPQCKVAGGGLRFGSLVRMLDEYVFRLEMMPVGWRERC